MREFLNKDIIITGGSGGNGSAICMKFLKSGARVHNLDIKKSNLKNKNLVEYKVDLSKHKEILKFVKNFKKKKKKILCLINNAGLSKNPSSKDLLKYWDETINLNLKAPFFLSIYLKNLLSKEVNSSIINISSIASKIAMKNNPAYNISKAGLNALTHSFAFDFSKEKIRVNSICPGYIKTNMTRKSYSNKIQKRVRTNRIINARYGNPEEIADLVIFLASKKSSYINAEEIIIDGGLLKKGI